MRYAFLLLFLAVAACDISDDIQQCGSDTACLDKIDDDLFLAMRKENMRMMAHMFAPQHPPQTAAAQPPRTTAAAHAQTAMINPTYSAALQFLVWMGVLCLCMYQAATQIKLCRPERQPHAYTMVTTPPPGDA